MHRDHACEVLSSARHTVGSQYIIAVVVLAVVVIIIITALLELFMVERSGTSTQAFCLDINSHT